MVRRDIVVIGASAGGVAALSTIVRGLPRDFDAAAFIVLHLAPYGRSVLPEILARDSALPVARATDGVPVRSGCIYVAVPDRHMLLENGVVRALGGPRINSNRPSIDALFRSAARCFGSRVIGVVLTGALDDGTAGLLAIKTVGGLAVVQSPHDARHKGMPLSALSNVEVDHCVSASEIAPLLARLVQEEAPAMLATPAQLEVLDREARIDGFDADAAAEEAELAGRASGFTCPTCHGALWDEEGDDVLRFRCRVGHAFAPESLLARQSADLEDALWTAYRALVENAALARRMAKRAHDNGNVESARHFEEQGDDAEGRAHLIREALLPGEIGGGSD